MRQVRLPEVVGRLVLSRRGDAGIGDIRDMVVSKSIPGPSPTQGNLTTRAILSEYVEHVLSFIDADALAREVSVERVLQRIMETVPAAWVHPGRPQSLPHPGVAT